MTDEQGPDDDGAVVLDIGGDVGALIVRTDASMLHVEIEISPNDERGEDVFQAEHPHEPAEHTHEHGSHEHGSHEHGSHTHEHTPGTTHVAVRRRRGPGGDLYAAVYPGLREGEYTLWNQDGTAAHIVSIVGGEVVDLEWT